MGVEFDMEIFSYHWNSNFFSSIDNGIHSASPIFRHYALIHEKIQNWCCYSRSSCQSLIEQAYIAMSCCVFEPRVLIFVAILRSSQCLNCRIELQDHWWVVNRQMIWKEVSFYIGWETPTYNLSQCSRCPDRDYYWTPAEYKRPASSSLLRTIH
jgi:hypothetical protein